MADKINGIPAQPYNDNLCENLNYNHGNAGTESRRIVNNSQING